MGIQRIERGGVVRYRARVKHQGREVATRVFDRRRDAVAWEQDQRQRLLAGDWIDPRRGRITLADLHPAWEESRQDRKRKTRRGDAVAWEKHIKSRFGAVPVASISTADVEKWAGGLVGKGLARTTAVRYLAALRSMLRFAVQDRRIARNVADAVQVKASGRARRDGEYFTESELAQLQAACTGRYAETVQVLGLCGLRFGELAGIQVGDLVQVPGRGLRLRRAVLADSQTGALYVETLKGHRARTVAMPEKAAEIVERWSEGKAREEWVFSSPHGGMLGESNWRRSVGWEAALSKIGRKGARPHDLRHTAASLWLASGADPKVVQRILGHASAAMTMDLYGHLVDANLWESAKRVGGTTGAQETTSDTEEAPEDGSSGA